jgi:SAM-dependent methyltransferase
MHKVNDSFFNGLYKEVWRSFIPEELTNREMNFLLTYFDLKENSSVLDIMCGYGRHLIALGRKGIRATGVDNLPDYIEEIKRTVEKEKLPVTALQQSVLDYTPTRSFNLAICMGNSLNFFDATDTIGIMKKIYDALQPGGHFLINSWSLLEIIAAKPLVNTWNQSGNLRYLSGYSYCLSPSRLEVEFTMIAPGGETETKKGVDYLYSINEMEAMLHAAGLEMEEVFSIPGKKKFTFGEPRAYLVARKPS